MHVPISIELDEIKPSVASRHRGEFSPSILVTRLRTVYGSQLSRHDLRLPVRI